MRVCWVQRAITSEPTSRTDQTGQRRLHTRLTPHMHQRAAPVVTAPLAAGPTGERRDDPTASGQAREHAASSSAPLRWRGGILGLSFIAALTTVATARRSLLAVAVTRSHAVPSCALATMLISAWWELGGLSDPKLIKAVLD